MKVRELINTYEGFKMLSEKELPFKAALTVAENMELLKVPYNVADKKRNKIIQEALERDENGQPIQLGLNSYKTKEGVNVQADLDALMEEEVSVEYLEKIEKADLESLVIEPKVLMAIRQYIL